MYSNYNKKPDGSTRFFFVTVAVIAAVLVTVIVFTSPSFFFRTTTGEETKAPPLTTAAPIETTAPQTAPPQTEPLPFDTEIDTGSVTDAPATSAAESSAPETTAAQTNPPETTAPPETVVPPETSPNHEAADPADHPCVLTESTDAGQEYLDSIIFLGDSTTYSFLYYGKLSGGKESLQVWTPASRTLTLDHAVTTTILYPDTGKEITVAEAAALKKPEIMVITLGVNGISYMQEEYFKSAYTKLVKKISEASPDTDIILQSIFPVAKNWEKTKSINNEKINNANEWIRDVADECEIRYLDSISVLAVAEDGYLPESYQNGDGLHLSPEACDIVLNYIRTHALPEYTDE